MKLFKKFSRYSALATGDFEKIFKDFEVPACPQVVTSLLKALQDPETTIETIASILEMDPGLSSKLLRLVNSSLYGLPSTVTSITRAVNLIGINEIKSLAVGYSVTKSLKDPKIQGFNLNFFIKNSLFAAIFAREIAKELDSEPEEAFTAALMQDIAIPTLLIDWFDVYEKVYKKWQESGIRLSDVEKHRLSWNHCEAGAWIAKKWEFPDLLVCAIGLHAKNIKDIIQLGLEGGVVAAVSLSSIIPSDIEDKEAWDMLIEEAYEANISNDAVLSAYEKAQDAIVELSSIFGV